MNKKKILLCSFFLCLLFSKEILALDVEKADFNVQAIQHENQLNPNVGYFLLHKENNLIEQPLKLKIRNNSNITEKYHVSFHTAKTNSEGLIIYNNSGNGPNHTVPVNIEEIVTIDNDVVEVPPHEETVITATVDTLKIKKIDGILAGAFNVKKLSDKIDAEGIGHRFSYNLGLVITDLKTIDFPNSSKLDLFNVDLKLMGVRKTIQYDIYNLEQQISRNLKIDSKLINKANNKIILEKTVDDYSIAPNGILSDYLDWGRLDVKSGQYVLSITATDEINHWKWDKEVIITKEDAKEINKASPFKVVVPQYTIVLVMLLLMMTVSNHIYLLNEVDYEK